MRQLLSVLFGAGFTVAFAWALGTLLFRRLRLELPYTIAGICGAPLLSTAVFLLCAAGQARTWVFLLLGIPAIGAAVYLNRGTIRPRVSADPLPWRLAFWVPLVLYAVIYLSNALAPEVSPDGTAYHLGLVARYFRDHGFHRITTNLYANLSQGMEMLFLVAFSLGRHSAAATVHCAYLLALPFLLRDFCRRMQHPRAGVCAAMLVFLSPLAGIDGSSAYNDIALSATAFGLFYVLALWRERPNNGLLVVAGLLCGFCFAVKYTGFVAVFYALAVVLWARQPRTVVPDLTRLLAISALIACPWLVKNWIWLGNPVSPFANNLFPNPFIHVNFEQEYIRYFRTYYLPSLRPLPWWVTVSGRLGGQIGPVFLLAPVALLGLRTRAGRQCLLAGLFFLLPYAGNIGARFLLPALPFAALGMAFALDAAPAALIVLIVASAIFAWPGVIDWYGDPAGGWRIETVPWKAALRIQSSQRYLERRMGGYYALARYLDTLLPDGARVWSAGPVAESYTKRDVLVSYQSAEGELLQDVLLTAIKPELQPLAIRRWTFPKRSARRLRLVQTASSPIDIWSVGGIQFFDGANEVLPARSIAQPNHWDSGLAFDHNPVTRWRSWEPIRPGMYLEAEFDQPVRIDRIESRSARDYWKIEVRPEICDGGPCKPLEAKLEKSDDASILDLRRPAAAFFRRHGVEYLLISRDYPGSADMERNPGAWGIAFLGEWDRTRLYHIQ